MAKKMGKLVAFIAGAAAATAGITYFLKSKRFKEEMNDDFDDFEDDFEDFADDAKEAVKDGASKAAKKAEDLADTAAKKAEDAAHTVAEKAENAAEAAGEKAEDLAEKAKDTVEDLADSIKAVSYTHLVASPVATLPAITCRSGYFSLIMRTALRMFLECPWAESRTTTSTFTFTRASTRSMILLVMPTAAPPVSYTHLIRPRLNCCIVTAPGVLILLYEQTADLIYQHRAHPGNC